jgi:hypothetical protein
VQLSTYRPGTALVIALATLCGNVQAQTYSIPRSTVRAVLSDWTQAAGYAVVWSDGIPDFPTSEGEAQGDLAAAARELVTGRAYGATNLYCPASTHFPAAAFTPDVRVDPNLRLLLVTGVPTGQECRPGAGGR